MKAKAFIYGVSESGECLMIYKMTTITNLKWYKTIFIAWLALFASFSQDILAQQINFAPQISLNDAIISDPQSGLALFGYDPVAYFIDARAVQGQKQNEVTNAGLIWRFANEGNRAAFIARPEVYYPQYGGYDPLGLIKGQLAFGDPTVFLIDDNQLYFFRNSQQRETFSESAALQLQAKQKWLVLNKELVMPRK